MNEIKLFFRERIRAGQPTIGTFLKTPSPHAVEILGGVGLDFVVIDAEHAPWDRGDIDMACMAARANSIAALVRVQDEGHILSALDCGATGVMVPHVSSVEKARQVAAACRYRNGKRGYSNSPRAGNYGGLTLSQQVDLADRSTTVIAMLEDPEVLDDPDSLFAVDEIDAFFLGRGDLSVAMGEAGSSSPHVAEAVDVLAGAARKAGKPLWAFVGKAAEIPPMLDAGLSGFIVSSDQGLLKQSAMVQLNEFGKVIGAAGVKG